jgi:hypothetical protein
MKANFLKIAKVKSEKDFYKKYPTEEAFFKAHPEARKMQHGGAATANQFILRSGLLLQILNQKKQQ